MKKQHRSTHVMVLVTGLFAVFMFGQINAMAQESGAGAELIDPGADVQSSEFVTINVNDADISQVLKAYSLQTGQSIVVGPDVVSENVNVRLNNIPWQDALDVILKPHGFGYRIVGDTIVVSKLENIVTVEGIEPLSSQVFTLRYLDAYDIKNICEAQLTSRGKFTILDTKGLPGWQFAGAGSSNAQGEDAGVRQRATKEKLLKSKTFVITDVPASLTAIADIIESMDLPPVQVLIEARFLEVNMDENSDIGLDLVTAMENVAGPAIGAAGGAAVDGGGNILNPIQALTDPIQGGAQGMFSQDNGLRLSYANIGDAGFDMLFKFQQSTDDVNILSAPRILTLDNQEAAILVGRKYPILRANTSGGSASSQSTITLDYYENIGIQLNVLPQVSNGEFVNMVVHPVVSEIEGFTDGSVELLESDISQSTKYPILTIREAETQILLKSREVAVIGGLQTQRDKIEINKVPLLGDIPFIGRLFRREIKGKQKIDLLIFIKATIVDREDYAAESLVSQRTKQDSMGFAEEEIPDASATFMDEPEASAPVMTKPEMSEPAMTESEPEEPMVVSVTAEPTDDTVDDDEFMALVQGMNGTNNAASGE